MATDVVRRIEHHVATSNVLIAVLPNHNCLSVFELSVIRNVWIQENMTCVDKAVEDFVIM
jgi:hypothetical protein